MTANIVAIDHIQIAAPEDVKRRLASFTAGF
jgi:hypothetical protein